ncbi:L-dopachrome tautomerase-related protein [Prosthecobacter sp. SYSU 5D2]|uniref:L-dopachrome tautomerase-related protein n=1 Tax=Prosthecobacter sp. SYSU 5D2 TaxID=3134134 RepID=UPI0031FE8A44
MKSTLFWPLFIALAPLPLTAAPPTPSPTLSLQVEEYASFPTQQLTGVAVSKTGRVFVNFPFWSDDHTVSVVEVMPDGSSKPYPGPKWNSKDASVKHRFICVQSVYVDDQDMLWILDPAAPKMETVIPGQAKLVKVDLSTNKVVKTYRFDDTVVPSKAYLNDVRVDTVSGHAFITESGTGSILVLDTQSGKTRRVLDNHPSTKAEKGIALLVDGIQVVDPKTGQTPEIHADGIALDQEGGWLYYHALTGRTLYRIKTTALTDATLTPAQLEKEVVNVATTPAPDGMLEAGNGSLYLTALEAGAILHFDPRSKETATLIEDPRLQWPDSLSKAPDGNLYVTASQIHRMPRFNKGQSQQKGPYTLYRIQLNPPPKPAVDEVKKADPHLPPDPKAALPATNLPK